MQAIIVGGGIHSTVRHKICQRDKARYFGNTAWRGIVPKKTADLNFEKTSHF